LIGNDNDSCVRIVIPPEMLAAWQTTVDLIAKIADIPASLIMKRHSQEIEVLVSSETDNNPYTAGARDSLGHGLYCETVIAEQTELLVSNALKDPLWQTNPDISLGMISYCGLPLNWPSGEPFGTICMLDSKANEYSAEQRLLLESFRNSVESSLEILYQKNQLTLANQDLERRISHRTLELELLNSNLMQEIDSRVAAEELLEIKKRYDEVTGLPRLSQLEGTFSRLVSDDAVSSITALHFNISNLKIIHDSLGFQVCEQVIKTVGDKLQAMLPSHAYLAHASDGAFCIIVANDKSQKFSKVTELPAHLCQIFNQNLLLEGITVSTAVNIGISVYPDDAVNFIELTRKSSAAISHRNHSGENSYTFFDKKMETMLFSRLQIESLLVDAIGNNELSLHYQPFVDTKTEKVIGAEALLRWSNPELGFVSPTDFIEVAEQSGQIIEIGYFVLRKSIQQAAYWRQLYNPDFYMAINLSPMQLKDESLVTRIVKLLELYQLPPQAIEIELTENALVQDAAQALKVLNELSNIGVRLSLDDFGTGYSSLSYLQNYPFSCVKIDRSFIDNLAESYKSRELVHTIISMAKNLNLSLIAEGVETQYQAQFVAKSGASIWQGYYYGKPTDADSFSQKYLINAPSFYTEHERV